MRHWEDDRVCDTGKWYQGYNDFIGMVYEVIAWPHDKEKWAVGGYFLNDPKDPNSSRTPVVLCYDSKSPDGPSHMFRYKAN